MNIAYSCNDAYVSHTGISMISVCENNKHVKDISFYLISKNISNENVNILHNVCKKYDRKLIVISFENIAYDLHVSDVGRHIETIYSKVYFSRIENLDKVIYLDSDTIIVNSLDTMWNISLDGMYMAVVETFTNSKKVLGMNDNDLFFNDGVALVNVNYCREQHLIERINKEIKFYNGNPPVLSEGVLNKVCKNQVKIISLKYNLMAGMLFLAKLDVNYLASKLNYSKDDIIDSCNNPVIIHYLSATYNRPWYEKCTHPYKSEYLKYKSISPWKNDLLLKGKLSIRIRLIAMLMKILGPELFDKIRNLKYIIK